MGVVVVFLATAAAAAYAYGTEAPKWVTAFALIYVSSTVGTIYAGDWLTLIFFWELMAVTSTLLVWQYGGESVGRLPLRPVPRDRRDVPARGGRRPRRIDARERAGRRDLLVLVDNRDPRLRDAARGDRDRRQLRVYLLHTWLPDTYPRPHVAAAVGVLSVFTTKTAVYVMYRAFPEGGMWLAYLGGFMAVYGAFFALLQYDPRRLLSYHIQAQVGYMLAGLGLATAVGDFAVTGGFAHLFNNVSTRASCSWRSAS